LIPDSLSAWCKISAWACFMICFFYLRGLCITPDHESCQQNVDSVHDRLYWLTLGRFVSEFALQLLNKTQISNRVASDNRFVERDFTIEARSSQRDCFDLSPLKQRQRTTQNF